MSACQSNTQYQPDTYMSSAEQDSLLWKIIRYAAKPPKRVSHENKFLARYDAYYQEQMKIFRLEKLYFDEQQQGYYFLVSRIAPSLKVKRVATGGFFKLQADGSFEVYEEIFRTFKMEEPELEKKSMVLFKEMLKKGNADAYRADRIEEEYVEFPDATNYYDKPSRRWLQKGSAAENQ